MIKKGTKIRALCIGLSLILMGMAGCSSASAASQTDKSSGTSAVLESAKATKAAELTDAKSSTDTSSKSMTPGVYTVTMRGFVSDITTEVEVDSDKIIDVRISDNQETVGIGSYAIERIPARIVENQSVEVDVVSGASITSRVILSSVTSALEDAGADLDKFSVAPVTEAVTDQTYESDIVIIGAGAAGLTAAVSAIDSGTEGANGEKITVNAKSVIVATGGFGANLEKCVELNPDLEGYVTNNQPGATGDGIAMGEAVGAAVVDLDQIQLHPTIHVANYSIFPIFKIK